MKPSQPMQVITCRLNLLARLAPAKPPQSEHAPDKVDEKTPGSLSSREESAASAATSTNKASNLPGASFSIMFLFFKI